MGKNQSIKRKYIKFVGKRKKAKKTDQRNDNIFTSAFFPEDKWGVLMLYEYYIYPCFKIKKTGVNWCIYNSKKETEIADFTNRYPIITFENWEIAKEFFDNYVKNIDGILEISD